MSDINWYDQVIKYKTSEGLVSSVEWKNLVSSFEGLRLKAYPDPGTGGKPWTIGYGHTLGVKPGDVITEKMAEHLLFKDVERFEKIVNRLVKVPLTQYQFDALTSFSFNVGGTNLKNSTLLKKLNQLELEQAADEFLKWKYANGRVLNGLVRRRKAERAMFKGKDWTDI